MKKIRGLMLAMLIGAGLCAPALAQIPTTAPAPPAPMAAPATTAPGALPAPAAPAAIGALAPAPAAATPAAASVTPLPASAQPPALPQQAKPPRPPKPAKAPEAPDAAATPQPPEPARAPEVPGRERGEVDPVNIRFEVTISYQVGTAAPTRRTAFITVSNGTGTSLNRGLLRAGNNVPVPRTTLVTRSEDGKETPAAKPLTDYNYRSVGLNVDITQATLLPGTRVRASLSIEFSGVDDKAASTTGAPSFPTFSQSMSLYLENGKPIVVAQSSDFVDNVERKQTVEVKATILR